MHTLKEKQLAIGKYMKYKNYSKVVNELGYPCVKTLQRWVSEYNKNGFLHEKHKSANRKCSKPKFNEDMILVAINHFNTTGKTISHTMRELGYPSRNVLKRWLIERDKNYKPKTYCFNNKFLVNLKYEEKVKIVKDALTSGSTIANVAKINDVSSKTVYESIKQLLTNNGAYYMKKRKSKKAKTRLTGNKDLDKLIAEKEQLEKELERTRVERDIYKKANELFNKTTKDI